MLPYRRRANGNPNRATDQLPGALILIVLLIGLLAPARVSAQEPMVPNQFNFSDPGARSMGFGGAFVALADDATAAFANPAGLVQLLRPEVSIEARRWSHSTPYTEGGRVEGLPSGNGIDNTIGLRTAESDTDVTGLSFLSLVYPKDNWSLAFFRHELANLEFYSETQGLFGGGETDCCPPRFLDQRAATDVELVSYGFSAAYRISDNFDLGLGVVYHDASVEVNATLFLPAPRTTAGTQLQSVRRRRTGSRVRYVFRPASDALARPRFSTSSRDVYASSMIRTTNSIPSMSTCRVLPRRAFSRRSPRTSLRSWPRYWMA